MLGIVVYLRCYMKCIYHFTMQDSKLQNLITFYVKLKTISFLLSTSKKKSHDCCPCSCWNYSYSYKHSYHSPMSTVPWTFWKEKRKNKLNYLWIHNIQYKIKCRIMLCTYFYRFHKMLYNFTIPNIKKNSNSVMWLA